MREQQIILILGGARSGKSDYAQTLAGRLGQRVLYLATATIQDEEMANRVAHHRASRPSHWATLEAPQEVSAALRPVVADYDVVLLDCLTLLASNVLLADEAHPQRAEQALLADLEALCGLCRQAGTTLLVVSNEVGMGVVPAYPLGRIYRDLLGRANQFVARRADRVLLLVAGIPVDVKALARTLPPPFGEPA